MGKAAGTYGGALDCGRTSILGLKLTSGSGCITQQREIGEAPREGAAGRCKAEGTGRGPGPWDGGAVLGEDPRVVEHQWEYSG